MNWKGKDRIQFSSDEDYLKQLWIIYGKELI